MPPIYTLTPKLLEKTPPRLSRCSQYICNSTLTTTTAVHVLACFPRYSLLFTPHIDWVTQRGIMVVGSSCVSHCCSESWCPSMVRTESNANLRNKCKKRHHQAPPPLMWDGCFERRSLRPELGMAGAVVRHTLFDRTRRGRYPCISRRNDPPYSAILYCMCPPSSRNTYYEQA